MSVGNQQIQYEYVADGNTVIFPFSCRVIYATDISVTIDGNIIKPDTYKVDGVDQPNGGNVVFYNAPAAGCYVVISRDIDLVRNTDYQTNGDFLAKTVNRDFDRIWMALQKFGNLQTEIDTVSNNMIQGWVTVESFEKGATLNLKNQVLLWEKDGQYYHWAGKLPKVIAKNSTPQTAGGIGGGRWVLIGDASLRASLASKAGASMVRTTTGESLQQILDAWPKNNNNLFLILVKMAEGGVVKIAC